MKFPVRSVVASSTALLLVVADCSGGSECFGTCSSSGGGGVSCAKAVYSTGPVLMQLTSPSLALVSRHRAEDDSSTPILIKHRHGLCLDASERNENGGDVHIWSCDPDNKNQQWSFDAETGQIRNLHGICLDSYERKDGGGVFMWKCQTGNPNQHWTYDSKTGHIKHRHGFCLDSPGHHMNSGKVHMWSCIENEQNQHWDFETGTSQGPPPEPEPAPAPAPPLQSGPAPAPSPSNSSWQPSGRRLGSGWCAAEVPTDGWNLHQSCGSGTQVKVLTYNLFWWNLFDRRHGNGGSAGKLIARNGPYDIMGFQECDDIHRVLRDAGLSSSYDIVSNLIAYKKDTWESIASTYSARVAEDGHWGGKRYKRSVHYARLRHRATGKVVFFANLHGPLPVNSGGICGQEATAYNILRVIATQAQPDDVKIFIGDLNADGNSKTQHTLGNFMHRIFNHWVDAIYSSCPGQGGRNLGSGGSDHDALEATFEI